jgi:hypothetical protein
MGIVKEKKISSTNHSKMDVTRNLLGTSGIYDNQIFAIPT